MHRVVRTPNSPALTTRLRVNAKERQIEGVRQLLFGAAVLAAISMVACRDRFPTESAAPHEAAAAVTAAPVGETRVDEAYLADVERAAPGFGGYFADSKGVLHVWVTASVQEANAIAAVREQFSSGRMLGARGKVPVIVAERGKYTFSQSSLWRERLFAYAVENKFVGIRALDVDEITNRVRLDVEGDPASASRAIETLGIDPEAVIIQPAAPLQDMRASRATMAPPNINSVASPLVGGVQIGWSSGQYAGGCTLGFLARLSGATRFVTASHCTGIKYLLDGTNIVQPLFSTNLIGTELLDPVGFPCSVYLLNWFWCRNSDAALFSLAPGVNAEVGLLARTQVRNGGGTYGLPTTTDWDQLNPYWVVDAVEQNNLYAGLAVDKVGENTGWTWGAINSTCFDIVPNQNPANAPGPPAPIKCAYRADALTGEGDSGGPVFYIHPEGDSRVTLAGITAIRYQGLVFSKYSSIVGELGAGLDARRAATLTTPVISGNLAGQAPTVNWASIPGATYYRVYRQWYRYSSGVGSNGWELFMVTTNTFADPNLSADAYTGASTPTFSTEGYIKYQVRPMSATESGGTSNTINFRLAP